MRVVLGSIGKCDDKDMSFITDPKSKKYFKLLNDEAPEKASAALQVFLGLKEPTVEQILKPMLQINPYFRSTAKELLKCSYFD